MDRQRITRIFEALKKVTQEHLARLGFADKETFVRFGRGWATYFHPMMIKNNGTYYPGISYGDRLITDAVYHPEYLNTQEMTSDKLSWGNRFGFSPAVILAAVIAHEIIHAYMYFSGSTPPKRCGRRRAHHGKDFYAALEETFSGHVEDMAIRIAEIVGDPSLLNSTYSPKPKKKVRRKRRNFPKPDRLGLGEIVVVDLPREGMFFIGEVVRWGGTRWTIVGKKYCFTGDYPHAPMYAGKEFKIYACDARVRKLPVFLG